MKNQDIKIVKVKGLKANFLGGVYGVYVAMNSNNEFGFLPGEKNPYTPIGGKTTLLSVMDILEFKPL